MNPLKMTAKYNNLLVKLLGRKPSVFEFIRYAVDGIWDYIIYGSTITDYFELTFSQKNHKEKKEYATWRHAKKLILLADSKESSEFFAQKTNMYTHLQEFIKRDQLFTSMCSFQEFSAFTDKHQRFLYKPNRGSCGWGIVLWNVDNENKADLYKKAINAPAVLDELIVQNKSLQQLCDKSVNTIRIFTLRIDGEIMIISAALRMGNGTAIVDNYSAGGIVGALDLTTGQIIDDGEDAMGKRYVEHPYSHIRLKGFQVPLWSERVLDFVKSCASHFPLNYVAWDIAVRENDCILVEANPRGMVNVIQIAGNKGKRQIYTDLIRKLQAAKK